MKDTNKKRASLAEIKSMSEKGELFYDPHAPEGKGLGAEFWRSGKIDGPLNQQRSDKKNNATRNS